MSVEGLCRSTPEAARTADAEIATPAPTRVHLAPRYNRMLPESLHGRARCSTPLARTPAMWDSGSGTLCQLPSMLSVPPSVVWPVANVVSGRIVVPSVYLTKPGAVKVNRDGRFFFRVTNPMNAPFIRQQGRDSVFPAPLKPPELLQAGMIGHRSVVGALVTFFQDRSQDATEGSPGGMVVDPGRGTRRPNEDLQRVGASRVVVAISYVPVLGPSRFLAERQDVRSQKVGVPHHAGQDGNSLP
jgi:hypothetical protein